MRTFLLAACASVSILGLSACGSTHVDYPGLPNASQTVVDEKALYVAEAAYAGLATLALEAVQSGALKGDQAAQVQVLNRQAYEALLLARAAKEAANSRTYVEQTTRALDLIAQAQALIRTRE
jgi:predicted lipid-binding transport protein (Tim44 family)